MTTPSNMILFALKALRVVPAGGSLKGEDADDGLVIFNRMMHGLKAKKIDLGWADLALSDTVPLDQQFEEPVINLLATALAPHYGTELTPEVAVGAAEGLALLQAHFGQAPLLSAPLGTLDRVNQYSRWNINNG